MESKHHFHREPDLLQRLIHGLCGALLGGLIGLAAGYYFEDHLIWIVSAGAAICFVVAFALGETAIEWILRAGWWT